MLFVVDTKPTFGWQALADGVSSPWHIVIWTPTNLALESEDKFQTVAACNTCRKALALPLITGQGA
jgi:hypothetical protein